MQFKVAVPTGKGYPSGGYSHQTERPCEPQSSFWPWSFSIKNCPNCSKQPKSCASTCLGKGGCAASASPWGCRCAPSHDVSGLRSPPASRSSSAMSVRAASRSTPSRDRKSTRLNSSHSQISYAVFCLKKKKHNKSELLTCQ